MLKKIILISTLSVLTNCTTPGTALLGPAFTGAKTGSLYQASLSFGTGKIVNKLSYYDLMLKDEKQQNSTFDIVISNIQNYSDLPEVLISYKIDKIEFSELIEPEPLP